MAKEALFLTPKSSQTLQTIVQRAGKAGHTQMKFRSVFLRQAILHLKTVGHLNTSTVLNYLGKAQLFDPGRLAMLESGIASYFKDDWLVACHILVPQMENAIRAIVRSSGGQTLKQGRNGGLQLRNIDELLHDPIIENLYGTDKTFWLRILLSDSRGWNLRNKIAHGISELSELGVTGVPREDR